jgi:hypothetical protein
VLAPREELRLLGAADPIDDATRELETAIGVEIRRAMQAGYDRGFQRGLIAAGEPWVALLAVIAGGFLGWAAHAIYGG